jgi:Zn-dependent protease
VFGLDPYVLLLHLPGILIGLTIHEFMHAWTALKLGDDTAQRAGRVSLNPLAHLEPLGTIMLLFGPIGWAKPVPVNPSNFKHETGRRDDILVSGAGIAVNFTLAVALALLARVLVWKGYMPDTPSAIGGRAMTNILWGMLGWAVFLNFGLAIFNLIPLFPLDGSHILKDLLPLNAAIRYSESRRYQPLLLGGLILFCWLSKSSFLAWPVAKLIDLIAGSQAADHLILNMWSGKA